MIVPISFRFSPKVRRFRLGVVAQYSLTVIAASFLLERLLLTSRVSLLLYASATVMTLIVAIIAQRYRRERARQIIGDLQSGASGSRVLCIGVPDEILPFREISDQFFEPIAINGRAALRSQRIVLIVCMLFALSGILIMEAEGFAPVFHRSVAVAVGLSAVSPWVYQWVFPFYVRVVPGQIELLVVSPIGRTLHRKRVVDLHRTHIVCNFDDRQLLIVPDDGSTPIVFDLDIPLTSPTELVVAVFRGAICMYSAPELPQSELLA